MLNTLTAVARRASSLALGVALIAAPSLANGTLADFTVGNLGSWTWGPPAIVEASGGNPGGWLHTSVVDTVAPQLRTTVPIGFTGNWRGAGVTSFGFDLQTLSTNFPALREATLLLRAGSQTVYRLGTETVPQPGTGWQHYDVPVPAASTTLPAGWTAQGSGSDDAIWNTVIANVSEVVIFYGDPDLFYIFDQWDVGADNLELVCGSPWLNLNLGLPGTHGIPSLVLAGPLTSASVVDVSLTDALAGTTAWFVGGFSRVNLLFKGGLLVPALDILVPVPTGSGSVAFDFVWPVGVPSGFETWYQAWVVDPAGFVGFAASNAVKGTTP